jgi:hypothetical protein
MENVSPNSFNANRSVSLAVGSHKRPPSGTLERHWAKFFDLLQVDWVYSPRESAFWLKFAFQNGGYARGIPAERGLWVAVSEFAPSDEMYARLHKLARQSDIGSICSLANLSPALKFGAGDSQRASTSRCMGSPILN